MELTTFLLLQWSCKLDLLDFREIKEITYGELSKKTLATRHFGDKTLATVSGRDEKHRDRAHAHATTFGRIYWCYFFFRSIPNTYKFCSCSISLYFAQSGFEVVQEVKQCELVRTERSSSSGFPIGMLVYSLGNLLLFC